MELINRICQVDVTDEDATNNNNNNEFIPLNNTIENSTETQHIQNDDEDVIESLNFLTGFSNNNIGPN